jgi:probable lipoprotein (TIGR04455 family)
MTGRTALPPLALLALCALGSGCAVRSVYVKPDFEQTDRQTLKRVAVAATPLPGAPAETASLLARIARRYVHQHKDYLATGDQALAQAGAWRALCNQDGLHGVLRVMVKTLEDRGSKLTLEMTADLLRCDSGVTVWRVEIRDTNDTQDTDLKELAGVYAREFGELARRYAAPLFIAVKTGFDSLPSPVLDDEETMEKISMDE